MRHPTQLHSGDTVWPSIRLLVFSQDDGFRFLVRQTFRKLNVRDVLSTSVSADATPMMGQAPHVALVDIDGDGSMAKAFLERVRAADGEIPVLAVAKANDKRLVADLLPLGIEGFLPKPISGHELSHRVGEVLKQPRRLPVPADHRPATVIKLEQWPNEPTAKAAAPKPAAASAANIPAETDPIKAQLAELTAKLGQSPRLGGGGGGGSGGAVGGGGKISGGTLGGGDLPIAPKVTGGKLDLDDLPTAPKVSGGKLDMGDLPVTKPKAGKLDLGDFPAPAATAKSKRDLVIEAAPPNLRPKPEDDAARRKAEKDRARWQEELAQAGHQAKEGKDVAGLDVDAIVAQHLVWLTTQGAEGKRANFRKMDLAGGDMARTILANADFREAELSDSCLTEARLDGADFRYATLGAAHLAGANLSVAHLRHADLRLANLEGASLRGSDLSGARLRGAKLAGADLKGATLIGSDLRECDLSKVENLVQAQVEKSLCDMSTRLPPGVSRPKKAEE